MNIPDYFEHIIKKHETIALNPPKQIYLNKIKNRIIFKIKTAYKLELLSEETKGLLGSTKQDIDENKNSENILKLESVDANITALQHSSSTMLQCSNMIINTHKKWYFCLYHINNLGNQLIFHHIHG